MQCAVGFSARLFVFENCGKSGEPVGMRSHYVASLLAARIMTRRPGGLIVNISSAAAAGYFLGVAYGVNKAALDRFTSVFLQLEFLPFPDQLDAVLNACGFDCVIDRHGISGGEDWKRRLGNLISEADTVVFVLTSPLLGS